MDVFFFLLSPQWWKLSSILLYLSHKSRESLCDVYKQCANG